MQVESLDKFHEAIERMFDIEVALRDYSKALRVLGNDSLAERLEFMARDIRECEGLVSEATGESLHDCIRQSGEATQNMLLGILGVCSVPRPAEDSCEAKRPKPIEE